MIGDSWWVNHRQRRLSALTIVEAAPGGRKLPAPPPAIAAILAACGKARKTMQVPPPEPVAVRSAGEAPVAVPGPSPEVQTAVRAIVTDFRMRLEETLDRARLPHDLREWDSVSRSMRAMRSSVIKFATGRRRRFPTFSWWANKKLPIILLT